MIDVIDGLAVKSNALTSSISAISLSVASMRSNTAEIVGPTGEQTNGGWYYHEIAIHQFVTPSAQTRIRFRASDLGSGSIVEAAVDDLRVIGVGPTDGCKSPTNYGDGKV